jgi:hypothetical protein
MITSLLEMKNGPGDATHASGTLQWILSHELQETQEFLVVNRTSRGILTINDKELRKLADNNILPFSF